MAFSPYRRRYLMLWQLLFVVLGTSWLWAPLLNPHLSYRTSLISQYETPSQPYSWLFRVCDLATSALLLFMASYFMRNSPKRTAGWLLLLIGLGIFADPLFTTSCRTIGHTCKEYLSVNYLLHATETTFTSAMFFVIGLYDAWRRKKLVSIAFVLFQIAYGILFISQFATQEHFNTIAQYVYQTSLIVWLAWFCRDFLVGKEFRVRPAEMEIVKTAAAFWAFINGILAILISLAHIQLLGRIRGIYFATNGAWLAQHGVIIGVIMLYLSRLLFRGELRARQIFLAITAIETLKYAIVTPNPYLLALYSLTFVALFIFRDDFDRGTIELTWQVRLRELYFMLGALLLATLAALLALDRDSRASTIAARTFDNFFDYVAKTGVRPHSHLRSVLLAHTISAFLIAAAAAILWILFRPYKSTRSPDQDYLQIELLLRRYSQSSEDFFKLWPLDKHYFWDKSKSSFIAYKQTGAVAFALANPIGPNAKQLMAQFCLWAKAHRLRPCFLPVYESSLKIYRDADLEILQIGSSAIINTHKFLTDTANDKWWRWQKNRAEKKGYVYDESSPPHSAALLQQLQAVSDAWLTKSGHAERGFALGHFDKNYLQKCIIHLLKDEDGRVIAFTNQLPQFNASSLFTVDLLRYLPEFDNAMPYLIYKTIERYKHYQYFDLGFVPFARAKGTILNIAKTLSADRFSARGLEQFKNKFNPDWQPNYMAYQGDLADLALIALNLEKAMEQSE